MNELLVLIRQHFFRKDISHILISDNAQIRDIFDTHDTDWLGSAVTAFEAGISLASQARMPCWGVPAILISV